MDRRHSNPAGRIKQRHPRGRAIVLSVCLASAFGLFLVLVLPQSGSYGNGLAQSKKPTSSDVSVQQPDVTSQSSATKKKLNDPSRSTATTTVVTQQPVAPLTFTLSPDNFTPYQGQLVHFTINPSRRTKPFPFLLDFGSGEEQASSADTFVITHRFSAAGPHQVKATLDLPADQAPDVDRNVPTVEINVQKLPLNVCGVPADSSPQIFVGQEISLSTQDLQDNSVSYRFVLRGRACSPTRTQTSQPASSTRTFLCSRSGENTAYVELDSSDLKPPAKSESKSLRVDPLPQEVLDLSASPGQAAIAQKVTFTASLSSSITKSACFTEGSVQYRFWFGEGQVGPWGNSSTATYEYKDAKSYDPYVEARIGEGEPVRKAAHITVAPLVISDPGPSVCILCLIIGGGVILVSVGLGSYFVSRLVRKPRPAPSPPGVIPTTPPPHQPTPSHVTYVFDSGERTATESGPQLSVNLQVRLNTQAGESQSQLTLSDARLIKSVRRHHV